MRASYDENDAKKQIARLQVDLKNAYNEVKQNICAKEKGKVMPTGTKVVDETLKMASALEVQKRAFHHENARLKQRLHDLEEVVNKGELEKAKYMEGAAWMAQRLTKEAEEHLQKLIKLCHEQKTERVHVRPRPGGTMLFRPKLLRCSV